MENIKYFISDRHHRLEKEAKDGNIDRFNFWRILIQNLRNRPEEYRFLYIYNAPKNGKFLPRGSELERDESKLLFLLRNLYLSANNSLNVYAISRKDDVQFPMFEIVASEFVAQGKKFLKKHKKHFQGWRCEDSKGYYLPKCFGGTSDIWPYRVDKKTDPTQEYVFIEDNKFYLNPFIGEVEKNLEYRRKFSGLRNILEDADRVKKSTKKEIKRLNKEYEYSS